jgi:pimeloyl-ACP methyl ester carboxylesterase
MIHGFGSGGGQFFKMFKKLASFFHVITVDLLGLGASGRPVCEVSNFDETLDFFIDSLHAYMDKTKHNQEPYYLLGHSFGGYISGRYALKHP